MANHLSGLRGLSNRYLIMRHGHSVPNSSRLVVSHPARGRMESNGLSGPGRVEVGEALARRHRGLGPETQIMCSDFSRATQTAAIVSECIGAAPASTDDRLRERHFGDLEGGPDSAYPMVWAADAADPRHHLFGVESADEVLERTTALVLDLEGRADGATFLLVSHGDVLQILQCGFAGVRSGLHRTLPHLPTSGIRELTLKPR